jgi:hypothetical protein
MDRTLYTDQAALAEANVVQTNLAASLLRLFDQTLVPTSITTKTELEAVETTLVGYPAGGYPLATWNEPVFAPGGGAVITSPMIQVVYASGASVAIGGYWVEDAAGSVREVHIYDPPRSLAQVGDGWPVVAQLGYGRNV